MHLKDLDKVCVCVCVCACVCIHICGQCYIPHALLTCPQVNRDLQASLEALTAGSDLHSTW